MMEVKQKRVELFLVENLPWLLIVLFYIGFVILRPSLLSFNMILFMVYSVIPLGFLVLAQSICLISGNIDLSVAAITGFVGMISGLVLVANPLIPDYISLFLPILIGAICGLFNGYLVGVLEFNPFIVTLGTMMFFHGLRFFIYRSTILGKDLPQAYLLLGGRPEMAIISFIIILGIFWFILNYTRFGTYVYAIGCSPQTARMMGINVRAIKFLVYIISGALCGLSALYYTGFNNAVPVTMAQESLFPSFAGAILGGVSLAGGRGSVLNAFAGTLLLAVIEGGLTAFEISPIEREIAYGLIVIAAIWINKMRDQIRDSILKPKL